MTESFIDEIRKINSLSEAILSSVSLIKAEGRAEIVLITDKPYSDSDETAAKRIARKFVPELFSCTLKITKLTPDTVMVSDKILALIPKINLQLAAFITAEDIKVAAGASP